MGALLAIDTTLSTRLLRDIAMDLSEVKARLSMHYARRCTSTDEQDADWTDLEARKSDLEAEFVATFYVMTGMRWSHATQVMA